MPDRIVFSDLRQQPHFLETVADRIWRAWWKQRGYSLGDMLGRLGHSMNEEPVPFALVAHSGTQFLGTASVIVSDLEERPDFTPWVAAVWVDPDYRKQRIGRTLVARASAAAFALGYPRIYLCATDERRNFYLRQEWMLLESEVGHRRLNVFAKDAG